MSHVRPIRRRWFQFSLRALLFLMLLVGVATAIYRWPWEVTKEQEFETYAFGSYYITDEKSSPGDIGTSVTTYHRDWRGKPVKHGPERFYVQGKLVEEKIFGEGLLHGLARCFNDAGEVLEERTFNSGIQHGPCRIGDGKTWVLSGHYHHDVKDGVWRVLANRQQGTPEGWFVVLDGEFRFSTRPRHRLDVPTDPIVVHEEWQRGKRHGKWEWRTMEGELLNTAQYANDRLTVWNGEDVPEDYWYWLADRDLQLFERLKEPAASLEPDPPTWTFLLEKENRLGTDVGLFEPAYPRQALIPTPEFRVLHYALPMEKRPFPRPDASIGENLLEHALLHGLAPDFRFGGLWFVPADEVTGCHDSTGVERVRFAAGSRQAREWLEPVTLHPGNVFSMERVQSLFHLSTIPLDLSAWNQVPWPKQRWQYDSHAVQRTRRDALGLALYRAGLQCEQRGDTLVIKPHWTHATK